MRILFFWFCLLHLFAINGNSIHLGVIFITNLSPVSVECWVGEESFRALGLVTRNGCAGEAPAAT
jgi:hypothetical protein